MDSDGGFNEQSNFEYKGIKTLRNLTVNQINSISNDSSSSIYLIDNAEVTNILVCGYVLSLRSVNYGIIFEIDDTTGRLSCAFWFSNNLYDEVISERIVENNLIKVTGSLKVFNEQKTLNISSIFIVDDNYLTYHFVSCIYQSLFYKNLIERKKFKQLSHSKQLIQSTKPNSIIDMSSIQLDTLQVYRNNQDETGLDLTIVVNMLKFKYSEHDIREAIDSLLNNCHLYSVDGDSYKTVA